MYVMSESHLMGSGRDTVRSGQRLLRTSRASYEDWIRVLNVLMSRTRTNSVFQLSMATQDMDFARRVVKHADPVMKRSRLRTNVLHNKHDWTHKRLLVRITPVGSCYIKLVKCIMCKSNCVCHFRITHSTLSRKTGTLSAKMH